MSIVALNNSQFAVSGGTEDIRIWSQTRMKGETADQESRLVWTVLSALKFRDYKVRQIIANIRLRLKNVSDTTKNSDESKQTLAILHE